MERGRAAEDDGIASASLNNFFSTLHSYQADFSQETYDAENTLLEKSTGTFRMKKNEGFLLAYEAPYRQTITSDSHTLWSYDHDLKQVIVRNLTSQPAETPLALLWSTTNIDRYFSTEQLIDNTPSSARGDLKRQCYQLTPKNDQGSFHRIDLCIAARQLDEIVLYDRLLQTTSIRFSNQEINPSLQNSLFTLEVSDSSVEWIDMRQPKAAL